VHHNKEEAALWSLLVFPSIWLVLENSHDLWAKRSNDHPLESVDLVGFSFPSPF
jgi:hypothetical protein